MAVKCPKCHTDNPDDTFYCGKCAAPLKHSADISVTKTLETLVEQLIAGSTFANRYKIIEELGKGGMGRVYKVHDAEINEAVALKLLKPEIASDEKTIERFRNELKIARKVSHKNVCRMYDIGREDDKYFITMEYVAGDDLRSLLRKRGKLSTKEAVGIAQQVCEGLVEAHRLGVVHRDLKPQNIMIDDGGQAKIMDFGIARSVEAPGVTQTGVIIGTPDYISPEQAGGEKADQRSDIYSLGVMLYEMVTGSVPFRGDTAFSVALKHQTQLPQDPRKLNSQISDDLSRLILVCMEKERERRYQTAADLLADLRNIEEGFPLGTKIRPRRKTFAATLARKKLLIPTIGIIALIVIAFLVWRLIPKEQLAPPLTGKPSLAILYFDNLSDDKSLDAWKTGLTELLITKLAQSRFIDVLDGNTIYSILKKLNLDETKKYTKEDLIKVASEGRATHTLSGSIMKAEQKIIVTLSLQKPQTGEVINAIPIECSGEEEIILKVDQVSRQIKSDLDLSSEQIAGDIDRGLENITTASPEAFKYYSQGREFFIKGEYYQSIPLMEKAISLDPEFAMAYRSLASAYYNLRNPTKRKEYVQKAIELSDRISERERYLIQGFYYSGSEKTYDKAVESYTKLIELYPDETQGIHGLGSIYDDIEEWDKAIERYEASTKRKVPSYIPYSNLAWCYEAKGFYEKARETLDDYAKTFSENWHLRWHMSCIFVSQGKFDFALIEANRAFSLAPTDFRNNLLFGQIYLLKGDFQEAEKRFQNVSENAPENYALRGNEELSYLYLLLGKFGKSKEQIEQGIERARQVGELLLECGLHDILCSIYLTTGDFALALKESERIWECATEAENIHWQRVALWRKGLAYVGMKSIDKAQEIADELKEFIKKGLNKKAIGFYHHLQGRIEFEKNNYPNSIACLKEAVSFLAAQTALNSYVLKASYDALFYDTLASVHLKVGDLESAKNAYEKLISLTWGRYSWGDTYAKSFYMLGKIHEQQDNTAKAKEYYEKFLSLWKDADPGLPEVEDAKKRPTGLNQ